MKIITFHLENIRTLENNKNKKINNNRKKNLTVANLINMKNNS